MQVCGRGKRHGVRNTPTQVTCPLDRESKGQHQLPDDLGWVCPLLDPSLPPSRLPPTPSLYIFHPVHQMIGRPAGASQGCHWMALLVGVWAQ